MRLLTGGWRLAVATLASVMGDQLPAWGREAELSWQDNSSNESGFAIERARLGLFWEEIATVGANVTTFTDTRLLPDFVYSYRVRAFNAHGHSRYSEPVAVPAATPASTSAAPVFTVTPVGGGVPAGGPLVLRSAATADLPVLYQWFHDGVAIAGANAAEYEIHVVQPHQAGSYHVQATADGVSALSEPVRVSVDAPGTAPGGARFLNFSTRARCGRGAEVMIPGFVVGGSAARRVLMRAVGPTLGAAPFHLAGFLPDPRMALQRWAGGGHVDVARNENWGDSTDRDTLQHATADVFAFALADGSRDAALVAELEPGQYTVTVDEEADRSGVVLVEVYDAGPTGGPPALLNYSNRGYVGAEADVMITGFVISPDGPMTVLIRAVGPLLAGAPFNVADVLADPVLEIYGSDGEAGQRLLLSNDNWSDPAHADVVVRAASQVHAFPLVDGGKDAALTATLPPGAYSAVVRGVNGGRGVALVEMYAVP